MSCIDVEIEKTMTPIPDRATVTLPRDNRWHVKDKNGYNTFMLMDSDGLKTKGLFQVGNEIEIKLGYDFNNKTEFKGFITGIEPKSPFTLICEDAMWKLKQNKVNISIPENARLSDIIDHLLAGTGVELHPDTRPENIFLGKFRESGTSTLKALYKLHKQGLISFIKDGKLLIGRSFFSQKSSIMKTSATDGYTPPRFKFEYDVYDNDLKLDTLDRKALAVKGVSQLKGNRPIFATIILHPDTNELTLVQYKDTRKSKAEIDADKKEIDASLGELKVDLSEYSERTLHYNSLEKEDLLEALMVDFFRLVGTGLSGNLVVFGDYSLQPATTIELHDTRNPEINGEFVIKSVVKKWGQRGYKQTLKIPHKFKNLDV